MNRNNESLLHAFSPLLWYYILSFIVTWFYAQFLMLQAGFFVMESNAAQTELANIFLQKVQSNQLQMIALNAAVGIPFLGFIYYRDLVKYRDFKWKNTQIILDLQGLFLGMAGSIALGLLLNALFSIFRIPEQSESYAQAAQALYSGDIFFKILGAGILAPISEEILIRGLIYGRFRQKVEAKHAIFWSSLLFGVMHGNMVQGVYGFLMGLFFGFLMEHFQTILAPILGHMGANLAEILILENLSLQSAITSQIGTVIVVICGSVCFIGTWLALNKTRKGRR